MSTESRTTDDTPSVTRPPPRRRSNEQSIKDFVVIIGSLMMLMCFGMLLEANIRGWNESPQMLMSVISFAGLCFFVTFFVIYMYSRMGKSCKRRLRGQSSPDVEQTVRDQTIEPQNDLPPSYVVVMGNPPAYNSIVVPALKTNDDKINDKHIVVHM